MFGLIDGRFSTVGGVVRDVIAKLLGTRTAQVEDGLRSRVQEQDQELWKVRHELDRLGRERESLAAEVTRLRRELEEKALALQRAVAGSAPVDGSISAGGGAPAADQIIGRLEALANGQWRRVLEELWGWWAGEAPPGHKAWLSNVMCVHLFQTGPPEAAVAAVCVEVKVVFRREVSPALLAALRSLADVAGALTADVQRSRPASRLLIPDSPEWQNLPFDPERFALWGRCLEGDHMQYLMFPGYRTENRLLVKPRVYTGRA